MLPVHFGLGDAQQINQAIINWPSGTIDTLDSNLELNKVYDVIEGQGVNTSTGNIDEIERGSIQLYPNPSNGTFQLEFVVSKPCNLRLDLFDNSGKLMHSVARRSYPQGEVTLQGDELQISQYPSGVYQLVMQSETGSRSIPFVISR